MSAPPTTVPRRPLAPAAPDWDRGDWNRPSPVAHNGTAGESAAAWDEPGWGRPAWQALLVVAAITTVGVVLDVVRNGTGGVNVAIIVGSVAGILVVRRLAMFPVVIAPPLVYMLGSAAVLYLRSGGPHNKTVLIDIATNWLVYGFPAMAIASAAVLLVAAIRMITKH